MGKVCHFAREAERIHVARKAPSPRAMRKVLDELEVPEKYHPPEIKVPAPVGRPSTYTLELAAEVCRRLSEGELLIDVSAEEGMPKVGTILNWREKHPEFAALYARAREMQAHSAAERAVRSGRAAAGLEATAARVQFDADRWLAAKLLPKVYGDKVETALSGGLTLDVKTLSPEERAIRMQSLAKKALTLIASDDT